MRLLVTVVVVVAGLVLPSHGEENDLKRSSGSCTVHGRVYQHGEIFTIGDARCIKYRCVNGVYDFYEEGCDKWDQCWEINKTFDYKCRRYLCYTKELQDTYKMYDITPVGRQRCEDLYGRCHEPGQRFTYRMHGKTKYDCTCQPAGATISYYCYD